MVNGKLLVPRGENPVATGSQSDQIAGPQLPISRRVDFDHDPVRGQGDLGALDRTERPDPLHRALQCAAARRPDLHVVAADKQSRSAGRGAIDRDIERFAAEPYPTIAHIHRQDDRLADEAVHERRCGRPRADEARGSAVAGNGKPQQARP